MTIFLCIVALIALGTEFEFHDDAPRWYDLAGVVLKVTLVLGILHMAMESYRL